MNRIQENFHSFCFILFCNIDLTIYTNSVQIYRHSIRIIRAMDLTLCNTILQISSHSKSHIGQKFKISLKWFQRNGITESGNCTSRRSSTCLIFSLRSCFHISKQIDLRIVCNCCRRSKLYYSTFSIYRCCIPACLLYHVISQCLSGNI